MPRLVPFQNLQLIGVKESSDMKSLEDRLDRIGGRQCMDAILKGMREIAGSYGSASEILLIENGKNHVLLLLTFANEQVSSLAAQAMGGTIFGYKSVIVNVKKPD
jgi:hypothetical protein